MEVTSVKIDKYKPKDRGICAECSIVLDNSLCIHKILVVMGNKGLFIAFPNIGVIDTNKSNKRYLDIVHPINNSLTQLITNEVISVYNSYKA